MLLVSSRPARRVMGAVIAATAIALLSVSCTSSEEFDAATASTVPPRALTPPDTADSLLFVVRSDRGRIVLDDTGRGTLTMDEVDDVTWFSDRPARDAGVTTIREALRTYGWRDDGDAVDSDAPNATLTASELGDALVVELLAASFDDDGGSFEVQAVEPSRARDDELNDLDLFVDTTDADGSGLTEGSSETERPDPATIAASAAFDSPATLADHVAGLLVAVGAGPADPDRTIQLAVRASYPIGGSGERGSIPVLLAPNEPVGGASTEISEQVAHQIEQWLSVTEARVDTFVFDATVWSSGSSIPTLVVNDVELPLLDVDLPSS